MQPCPRSSHDCHLPVSGIADMYQIDGSLFPVLYAFGYSIQRIAMGLRQVMYHALGRNPCQRLIVLYVIAVCGSSKGQVGEGEHHTTHHTTQGIAMLWHQRELTHSTMLCQLIDGDTRHLCGISV